MNRVGCSLTSTTLSAFTGAGAGATACVGGIAGGADAVACALPKAASKNAL